MICIYLLDFNRNYRLSPLINNNVTFRCRAMDKIGQVKLTYFCFHK